MPEWDASRVTRRDAQDREHTVRIRGHGPGRTLTCETCRWTQGAQFLPWLKAQEHLSSAHAASRESTGE